MSSCVVMLSEMVSVDSVCQIYPNYSTVEQKHDETSTRAERFRASLMADESLTFDGPPMVGDKRIVK